MVKEYVNGDVENATREQLIFCATQHHEENKVLRKRIAELEQENKVLEVSLDHCIKDWQVEQMMLEQQANGAASLLKKLNPCFGVKVVYESDINKVIKSLLKQASEVK